MGRLKSKIAVLLFIFLSFSNFSSGQLKLASMHSFIRLDFDELDEQLSKEGYQLDKDNKNFGTLYGIDMQAYIWKSPKTNNSFTVYVQQDTVPLKSGDSYQGHANVNKYSVYYSTTNLVSYNFILDEVKKSSLYSKQSSNIDEGTLITQYDSNDFAIVFMKKKVDSKFLYAIQLMDKSYEIVETPYDGSKTLKHSKKRLKPFFN